MWAVPASQEDKPPKVVSRDVLEQGFDSTAVCWRGTGRVALLQNHLENRSNLFLCADHGTPVVPLEPPVMTETTQQPCRPWAFQSFLVLFLVLFCF